VEYVVAQVVEAATHLPVLQEVLANGSIKIDPATDGRCPLLVVQITPVEATATEVAYSAQKHSTKKVKQFRDIIYIQGQEVSLFQTAPSIAKQVVDIPNGDIDALAHFASNSSQA
jgi:hypothetical protein